MKSFLIALIGIIVLSANSSFAAEPLSCKALVAGILSPFTRMIENHKLSQQLKATHLFNDLEIVVLKGEIRDGTVDLESVSQVQTLRFQAMRKFGFARDLFRSPKNPFPFSDVVVAAMNLKSGAMNFETLEREVLSGKTFREAYIVSMTRPHLAERQIIELAERFPRDLSLERIQKAVATNDPDMGALLNQFTSLGIDESTAMRYIFRATEAGISSEDFLSVLKIRQSLKLPLSGSPEIEEEVVELARNSQALRDELP